MGSLVPLSHFHFLIIGSHSHERALLFLEAMQLVERACSTTT